MSKMDNLRAMREARYAAMTKRSEGTPDTAKSAAAARKRAPVAPPTPPAAEPGPPGAASTDGKAAVDEPALCGHRNMSGRTCTREHGHAAKSHRYS